MKQLLLAGLFCCIAAPSSAAVVNYVPNDGNGNGNNYSSISADGNTIAYLSDATSGLATVNVYNKISGLVVNCSLGCDYVGRPRLSRDGKFVTYLGTPFDRVYAGPPGMLTFPVVASTTTGVWNSAVAYLDPLGALNSTSQWVPSNSSYNVQAPGISSTGTSWSISFGDLIARTPPPQDEWICTSSAPNSQPAHVYYTPGYPGCRTDMNAKGTVITYIYQNQVYVNGVAMTAANQYCEWPSIDGLGDLVTFDSPATNLGGPLTGNNVYILNTGTGAITCPYAAGALSAAGSCTQPFLSSNGLNVAFIASTKLLVWSQPYVFPLIIHGPVGPYAAICPLGVGTSPVTIMAFDAANPNNVQISSDPCAKDAFGGAFECGAGVIMPGGHWPTIGNDVYYIDLP